jgi:SAM-dependent methyltransferase
VGIDIHNLNFLAHAQDLGVRFGRTLAIGRQALFIEDHELEAFARRRQLPPLQAPARTATQPRYFEPLMQQWLGTEDAESVDASPYEHATHIHDMNQPWPAGAAQRGHYDAVLDFGCLEHVFNFPVAWRNCVDLCRVGGHVLHALPANNLSGHGFYQFSPELFFNLYQPAHGFELRGLWFAMTQEPRYWWRVANPMEVKRRVNLCNSHEVYLLVLARKLREPGVLPAPQQSDYAQDEWVKAPAASTAAAPASTPAPAALGPRQRVVRQLATLGLLDVLRAQRERWRALRHSGLDLPAPDYQRVDVRALTRRPR